MTLNATCSMHQGAVGFTNLVVSKHDGCIELDPHATGTCVITLDEDAACVTRCADRVAGMTWYLQSPGDHDTHRGQLRRGRVRAACGVEFTPLRALRSGPALPGDPPDPDQVCPACATVAP